ncbi:hypothetical protein CFFPNG_03229 [Methylorubrum aminovorans]|nr:hypothetical protein [Methylobacterium sp. CLZ]
MSDDIHGPAPTPEPDTTDAGDRKVVPLVRPRPSPLPVPAGEDDDPGPRAA